MIALYLSLLLLRYLLTLVKQIALYFLFLTNNLQIPNIFQINRSSPLSILPVNNLLVSASFLINSTQRLPIFSTKELYIPVINNNGNIFLATKST